MRILSAPTRPPARRAGTPPRELIARRPADPDQRTLIADWPEELAAYGEQLWQSPAATRMFDEDWQLCLITDPGALIAAQGSLVLGADRAVPAADDLEALARWTLPLGPPVADIPAQFDPHRQVWRVSSPNPNLRITGRFGGEVRPGALGFGFIVEVLASYVSVAEFEGRYILRDGYHRVHAALAAGVTRLPALVRGYATGDELFAQRMLAPEIWTGPSPPLMRDFADDRLAYELERERVEAPLYIQARPADLAINRET